MTRDQILAYGRSRAIQRWKDHTAAGLEDYQFICGGDPYRLSARQAAERLGVSTRTIVRWRKRLRDTAGGGHGLEWDGSPPYEWRREYLAEWDGGAA